MTAKVKAKACIRTALDTLKQAFAVCFHCTLSPSPKAVHTFQGKNATRLLELRIGLYFGRADLAYLPERALTESCSTEVVNIIFGLFPKRDFLYTYSFINFQCHHVGKRVETNICGRVPEKLKPQGAGTTYIYQILVSGVSLSELASAASSLVPKPSSPQRYLNAIFEKIMRRSDDRQRYRQRRSWCLLPNALQYVSLFS